MIATIIKYIVQAGAALGGAWLASKQQTQQVQQAAAMPIDLRLIGGIALVLLGVFIARKD